MYHKAFSARLSLVIACGLLALTPGVVQAQTTVTEIRNESDTPLLRLQDAGSGAALFSLGNVAPDRPLTLRGRSTSDADQFMSFYDAAGNAQWHLNWMTTPGQQGLNFAESGVSDFRLFLKDGGGVGIGTNTLGSDLLRVAGTIRSTSGGFAFPDATTQTTAAVSSGAASSRVGGMSVSCCTLATLTSRSITVPTDGYVVALGGTEAQIDHTFGLRSSIHFGISTSSTTLNSYVVFQYDVSLPTGRHVFPIAVHGIYPVTAGTHTFYFLARHDPNTGGSLNQASFSTFDMKLTLLFVPKGYGTVTASKTDELAGDMEVANAREAAGSAATTSQAAPDTGFDRIGRLEAELEALRAELEAMRREVRAGAAP